MTNILHNIQSAFIDINEGENGFIHISDILENTKKFEEMFDMDFDLDYDISKMAADSESQRDLPAAQNRPAGFSAGRQRADRHKRGPPHLEYLNRRPLSRPPPKQPPPRSLAQNRRQRDARSVEKNHPLLRNAPRYGTHLPHRQRERHRPNNSSTRRQNSFITGRRSSKNSTNRANRRFSTKNRISSSGS